MALKVHSCMQDANHIDRIGDDAIEHNVCADGLFAIAGERGCNPGRGAARRQ